MKYYYIYTIRNHNRINMKGDKVSVRLSPSTSTEIKDLCSKHKVSTSTMIRSLLKRSLDEVRSKTIPEAHQV